MDITYDLVGSSARVELFVSEDGGANYRLATARTGQIGQFLNGTLPLRCGSHLNNPVESFYFSALYEPMLPERLMHRLSFLRWPLLPLKHHAAGVPEGSKLAARLAQAPFSIRLLRYWWAGQALAEEARKLGRPLTVVDLGCERGWLKHFTPKEAVSHWIGLDWNPKPEARSVAGYDEVLHTNADESLPVPSRSVDAVTSLHVFEHLPRPGATLAEVSRILKPGGIFLGGTPTLPDWIARLREAYFRREMRDGRLTPGGHITCLSPYRWRSLAREVGLRVEFAVGSHAIRSTGSRLEHSRLWIRLNQFWGALFPALGSECYLRARREPDWDFSPAPLPRGNGRPRLLWAAAAGIMLVAVAAIPFSIRIANTPSVHCPVGAWLDQHQSGNDHFLVLADDHIPAHIRHRGDVTHVQELDDLHSHLLKNPDAHVLVENDDLDSLLHSGVASGRSLISRLSRGTARFYLLEPKTEPLDSDQQTNRKNL